MRHPIRALVTAVLCLLSAVSCRSILGISPGHEAADGNGGSGGSIDSTSGASGDTAAGGTGTTSGGRNATGGSHNALGGSGNALGGSGNSLGGELADAGTSAEGGQAGAPPVSLFPDPTCSACFNRNCPSQVSACQADTMCPSGVPDWLSCKDPGGGTCVTKTAGPLQDLETCGVDSCDVCQHLNDGLPSVEILSPSNGAVVPVGSSGLIEVTVRVRSFKVQPVGACGADTGCGHIHLNLDGTACHVTPFYNQLITTVAQDGTADAAVDTKICMPSVLGRPVALTASLSSNVTHADRTPPVQSTVKITPTK